MTDNPENAGPGSSPGVDDEVTVSHLGSPDAGAGAHAQPVLDGAQELRDEAEQARSEGMDSRADHAEGPGPRAQQATQTAALDDAAEDEQQAPGQ